MQIDISGLDKAAVLAALVNSSQPLRMGWMDPNSTRTMTVADAREEMAQVWSHTQRHYFDYVWGRPIKVDLSGSSFDSSCYDRDNSPAADVVNELRNQQ